MCSFTQNIHTLRLSVGGQMHGRTHGRTDARTHGRTDGRTENIYSIFRDKLLLLGEHVYRNLFLFLILIQKSLSLSHEHSFTLHPSLSPHRQNDGWRNEYTRFAWAGGTFSPVVLLCQFSVLARNRFWFYILLMYLGYHTAVVMC